MRPSDRFAGRNAPIRRGRYAAVTSTAALVVALGGTTYAATMISSSQIVDGTIQNRDIRAGTVTGTRVHDGTLGSADLAPDARSRAYATYHDADVGVPAGSTVTVLSLGVPQAGDYVVDAKLEAGYAGAADTWIYCGLNSGGDVDYSLASLAAHSAATVPFQLAHTFAAGDTIVLRCNTDSADVSVKNLKITAVSVDSLTNTGA